MHRNFLPPKVANKDPNLEEGQVDVVKTTSADTSYALTGSLADGSVNIWSTGMGLGLAGGFNFKKQLHQSESIATDKQKLDVFNASIVVHGGAELYLRSEKFLGELSKPEGEQKEDPTLENFKVVVAGNASSDAKFEIEKYLLKSLKETATKEKCDVMGNVRYLSHLVQDVTKIDKDAFSTSCEGASVVYLVFDLLDKSTYEQVTETILPWFKAGDVKAKHVVLIGTNVEKRSKAMLN